MWTQFSLCGLVKSISSVFFSFVMVSGILSNVMVSCSGLMLSTDGSLLFSMFPGGNICSHAFVSGSSLTRDRLCCSECPRRMIPEASTSFIFTLFYS